MAAADSANLGFWNVAPAPVLVLPGVLAMELEPGPLLGFHASSTWPSIPGISLPLSRMPLKNFSAVLRSVKVMSVAEEVVCMSVNSPMPYIEVAS